MAQSKAITLHLAPADYERLAAEAQRRGLSVGELARTYVQAALPAEGIWTEERRKAALEALDRLAELRADLPPVDAVQIARESRKDLERRSIF